jgi:hypothetical protein
MFTKKENKKIEVTSSVKLYRQAWKMFDHGFISKDEYIKKLDEIKSR